MVGQEPHVLTRQGFPYIFRGSISMTSNENCDTTTMPPGAPPLMKIGRRYSVPGQYVRMRSTGLVVRSCSDWCPEPVTQLDLDTCWHHPLSPASPREVEHARQPLALRVSRQPPYVG